MSQPVPVPGRSGGEPHGSYSLQFIRLEFHAEKAPTINQKNPTKKSPTKRTPTKKSPTKKAPTKNTGILHYISKSPDKETPGNKNPWNESPYKE